MAIGASPRDVHHMIVRQSAVLGVTGTVVGLCVAAAARPLISAMVSSTGPRSDTGRLDQPCDRGGCGLAADRGGASGRVAARAPRGANRTDAGAQSTLSSGSR